MPGDRGAFDGALAREVIRFLEANPGARDVAFACDAGLSRSPALVAACLRGWGYGDGCVWLNPHYRPNPLVYQVMCAEYGVRVTDGEAARLAQANEDALAAAIERATAGASRDILPSGGSEHGLPGLGGFRKRLLPGE